MSSIFIQIASYRDPQLPFTLKDCIEKAKYPENLKFCIAWQHGPEEKLDTTQFGTKAQFKILDIPHEESKGACWARNKIQQEYNNETYTLQLDSHHRFLENWDEELINMLEGLRKEGHQKPLLTGYIPSFNPEKDPEERVKVPWRMNFDRFIPEGAVFFLPATIPDWEKLTGPVPSRFYSAHFCFTDGIFAKEVQHDPEYYFHGEEISIGVRAFTHGYDLFHPHKPIIWHEYTRKGRTKQWDDDKEWWKKNASSHLRNRKLFEMDGEVNDIDFGKYGFGNVRTLRDYEKYAGLSFKKRAVQKHTLDHNPPPNPTYATEKEFEDSFLQIFKHCIDIHHSQVPETDYEFWVVAFHDSKDNTLFRKDATKEEIKGYVDSKKTFYNIWREFQTETKPTYWVVWPYSKSKGWCERIKKDL
jgi:GT2 family glycosyltransferase